jgi:leucyl-tRNA synthetase
MTIHSLEAMLASITGVILTSGVVAAAVTFLQNRWLENRRSDEAERTRLRQSFAEAFAAYADYKEFPYAIRRRTGDKPAEERARLNSELRALQSKLSYYRAWTKFESRQVGEAYASLLQTMRTIAGTAIHEAWNALPSQDDAAMNIPVEQIDLRMLEHEEDKYIAAVTSRLDVLAPRRLKRGHATAQDL